MKRNWDTLKLFSFLLLAYTPFMGFRVARIAGDEKLYVAQALEMERAGNWFIQTLAGKHEYFKGPLHYILVRIGSIFFGHTMWALVYMNLLLLLCGAYSIYRLTRRHAPERPRGLALFAGIAFATCAGVYGHAFASQMECELACAFAVAINLFDRSHILSGRTAKSSRVAEWAFWIVVGLTGLLKSPLYSVLLGVSAFLSWAMEGTLRERLLRLRTWGPIAAGVAVCALGYLPPLLSDREAYLQTFWLRENFGKGGNGGTWWEAVFALTTSFLFPWSLLAFTTYLYWPKVVRRGQGVLRLERHAWAWLLPSVLFFAVFPYHGQGYNVPVLGPLLIWVTCELAQAKGSWARAQDAAIAMTGAIFAAFSALAMALWLKLEPRPEWLWGATLPLCILGGAASAALFFQSAAQSRGRNWGNLGLHTLGFFLGFGTLLANVGERELWDIRQELKGEAQVYYDELANNQWSEWGALNFMIAPEVLPIFDETELVRALSSGRKILVPGDGPLVRLRQIAQGRFPARKLTERKWKRWRVHPQNGEPVWKSVWRSGDLSLLERDYFVVFLSF